MKNLKVEGYSDLLKTPQGAVINNNTSEYHNYIKNKNKQIKKDKEIETLKSEIEELKSIVGKLLNERTSI